MLPLPQLSCSGAKRISLGDQASGVAWWWIDALKPPLICRYIYIYCENYIYIYMLYIYIYMLINIYIYIYIYIYLFIYICKYLYIYLFIYLHIYIHICIQHMYLKAEIIIDNSTPFQKGRNIIEYWFVPGGVPNEQPGDLGMSNCRPTT